MIDRKQGEALMADLREPYEWTQREETSPHRVVSATPFVAADAIAFLLDEVDRLIAEHADCNRERLRWKERAHMHAME